MAELYESLAYILAIVVALAIVLTPIALAVLLIIWLFKKIVKPKAKAQPEIPKTQSTPYSGQTTYQTGWTWNEKKMLWEPPAGTKTVQPQQATVTGSTTYRFTKESIRQDDIPHNDWRTMEQPQKTRQATPAANTSERYVMPHTGGIQGYKAKYLLTKNEWNEHKKLREYATKKGLQVCPKVRMLDLVTPYGNGKDYMTRFHKVQAKHVDFVLVDEGMHIRAIVELDDASHDTKEGQERDQFVDEVLSGVGYTVIHTRCITEQTLSRL